jgi:hypothetical protein
MNNGFPLTVKGRIRGMTGIQSAAGGGKYLFFEVAPPDALNGGSKASCIAFNLRAELLERFCARGDLVEIGGLLGREEYADAAGRSVAIDNILEATSISFPGCRADSGGISAETA